MVSNRPRQSPTDRGLFYFMEETWKDIKGYKGLYQVSNFGRVKSLRYNRLLKVTIKGNGYCVVKFTVGNKPKQIFLHRILAEAFLPNPEHKAQVNHINGIKYDNRLVNLEWATKLENMQHAFNTGLIVGAKGKDNYNSKLTEDKVRIILNLKGSKSAIQIGKDFGVSDTAIRHIFQGKKWFRYSPREV